MSIGKNLVNYSEVRKTALIDKEIITGHILANFQTLQMPGITVQRSFKKSSLKKMRSHEWKKIVI